MGRILRAMARDKCTKQAIRDARRLKRSGANDCDIAAFLGVHPSTFSHWLNHPRTENQRQLCQALKRDETEYKGALLTIIAKSAQERDWKAAAWLLERKYPDEYGRRDRAPETPQSADVPAFYDSREEAERG